MTQSVDVLKIIEQIYEAAIAPGFWPQALARVAAAAGTEYAVVFTASPRITAGWASEAAQPFLKDFVSGGWPHRNERTPKLLAREEPMFLRDTDVYAPHELLTDTLQNEFLVPRGLGREVATAIALPSGHFMVFSIHFSLSNAPIADSTVHVLNAIRPHLARASLIAATLAQIEVETTVRALDLLGIPCAVIGQGGRVLGCNDLFATDKRLVVGAGDRLRLRSSTGRLLLDDILARADAGFPEVLSLLLPAEEGTSVAVLHVVPLLRTARDRFNGGLHIVVVTEAASRRIPSVEFLKALFDLTPAEANLARELVAGRTLPEVAHRTGRAHETMRVHLKSLLRKTGTSRQSELVRILSHMPSV